MPFRLEAGVNRSIVPGETIAAISTAAGEAAIALIRISGKDAIEVADKVFRGNNGRRIWRRRPNTWAKSLKTAPSLIR